MINQGQEWLIRGEGMPKRFKDQGWGLGRAKEEGGKGDMYLKFEVEMPGPSWASRQDPQGTKVQLPPALPDFDPLPDTVETRHLSPTPR